MPRSAIVVDEKDKVATALRELAAGLTIQVEIGDGTVDFTLAQDVPFGHKFALMDIESGDAVVKYGEVIGLATQGIGKGEHTHVHNVEGPTGRDDGE
jgi:altronate dehydratase small subunit